MQKKQYQGLNKFLKSDKKEEPATIKKEKPTIKKCNKSYLIYNTSHSFYNHFGDIKKFDNLSLESKY